MIYLEITVFLEICLIARMKLRVDLWIVKKVILWNQLLVIQIFLYSVLCFQIIVLRQNFENMTVFDILIEKKTQVKY